MNDYDNIWSKGRFLKVRLRDGDCSGKMFNEAYAEPPYGGWSESDVIAYLRSQFPDALVVRNGSYPREWLVVPVRGLSCIFEYHPDSGWAWVLNGGGCWRTTLPEAVATARARL